MARKTSRDRGVRGPLLAWSTNTIVGLFVMASLLIFGLIQLVVFKILAATLGYESPSWNPILVFLQAITGRSKYPGWWWATVIAIYLLLVVVVAILWWWGLNRSQRRMEERVDRAVKDTGASHEIAPILETNVAAKAKRLGVDSGNGLPLGSTIKTNQMLYSSFEDVAVLIAGARMGKTTGWVVPRILAAPGALVVTSNKRDVVDATRYARSGSECSTWIFDPQNLIGEPQTWWWNPLGRIKSFADAVYFVKVIADATRDSQARTDAFFDNAAKELAAGCVLAAAVNNGTLKDVYAWLSRETDATPARILFDHSHTLAGQCVQSALALADKTRSGVYASARNIFEFVKDEGAIAWVTPPPAPSHTQPVLREFTSAQFVTSKDALYVLSQEGRGNAAPIVTALTVEIAMVATDHAAKLPEGRLNPPMLIELDEAANVCPWSDLPKFYSHFGSRGICVDTILQSWSQGKNVWGEFGMRAMWEAANINAYGGGSGEESFMKELSAIIGERYLDQETITRSASGNSTAIVRDGIREAIAPISDLAALPANRMWIRASGAAPVLCRKEFYYNTPLSSLVQASIDRSTQNLRNNNG